MSTAPLLSAAVLPDAEFPLGRMELPETRTQKTIRTGVTHVHVERGYHVGGNPWAIFSGALTDGAAIAELRACLEKSGLKVQEERFQAPRGGERYSILSAGEYPTKKAALEAFEMLGCGRALQVQHRAAIGRGIHGPWTLDLIVIEPALYKGRLVSARAPAIGPVSALARAHKASVAINGSFFHGYPPPGTEPKQLPSSSGISIVRGEWYNEPDSGPEFFVENTEEGVKAWIAQPHVEPELPELKWLSRDEAARLTGINRMPREEEELVAMHPEVYVQARRFDSFAAKVLVLRLGKNGELSRLSNEAPRLLAEGDLVLLATGKWRAKLEATLAAREHMALDLTIAEHPELSAFRGGPILLRGGQPVLEDWRDVRFARTAAGIDTKGRILLLTIDADRYEPPALPAPTEPGAAPAEGGNLGSVGAKLSELRNVMQFLGAVDAINLDGGGTLVIEGELASRPIDPISGEVRERRYLDALLLVD